MRMDSLAHAAIDRLALEQIRLEPCTVQAMHQYMMEPAPVERFVYILRGRVCFSLEKESLDAGSRDMVYLPRDTAYRSCWLEDAEFVVVDILLRDSEGNDIRFGDAPCVLFHDTHQVYDGLLKELGEKAEATGPFDWLERLSLCFKLLCDMARDTNREELDENRRRIRDGLAYLRSNYKEDFPVDRLAEICGLSAASFRRYFLASVGISPVEYRNRLRVRKAAELLRSGQYTVGEAAEQVGIRDVKYFGKLFQRYMGITPGELRKGK